MIGHRNSGLKILFAFLTVGMLVGCLKNSSTGPDKSPSLGNISLRIAVASYPFKDIADSASITISASDMKDVVAPLTITDSTVEGRISNVPAGKSRTLEVVVFDSTKAAIYKGFTIADIKADTINSVSITVNRIVGAVKINGTIVESPANGWSIFDGFEDGPLSSSWRPYPSSVGSITTERAHGGTNSFKITTSDFKYTFNKPITNGKISWWYYDNSGTPWSYFYILTDTSKADLTIDNLHIVTNNTSTYSFYHKTTGYKNDINRVTGWRNFVAVIANGKISLSVDGQIGITIDEANPVLGFQAAGAIFDDFNVLSNTN